MYTLFAILAQILLLALLPRHGCTTVACHWIAKQGSLSSEHLPTVLYNNGACMLA